MPIGKPEVVGEVFIFLHVAYIDPPLNVMAKSRAMILTGRVFNTVGMIVFAKKMAGGVIHHTHCTLSPRLASNKVQVRDLISEDTPGHTDICVSSRDVLGSGALAKSGRSLGIADILSPGNERNSGA